MRTFADRANKVKWRQDNFWNKLHQKKQNLMRKFAKMVIANPDLDLSIEEEEKKIEKHMRHRLRQLRTAFAKLLRKHRHDPIGMGIGGRDCDGYDWETIRLYDNTDFDTTDPENQKIVPRDFGCAYWQAVKSARGTMDYADGPTSWGFMSPEDVEEYHRTRNPNEPVGRCGWDDDSMEPWTPEQIAEGWHLVGDGLSGIPGI